MPESSRETRGGFETKRALDLLFVIDNSGSMEEEQRTLDKNFPVLIEALDRLGGGKLDLHLGVVTSDLGAGPTSPDEGCRPVGDRGELRAPDGCGLQAGARFISDDGQGGRNFSGKVSDVFGCLAQVGTNGCGYEHQLQALRVALSQGGQTGFLRENAVLGVVLVTDEDDCSAPFDSDLFSASIDGETASFRCAQRGHLCGGSAPGPTIAAHPLSSCQASPDGGGKLIAVGEFVDFMRKLKRDPRMVVVSAIAGWPKDGEVGTYRVDINRSPSQGGQMDVMPVCSLGRSGPGGSGDAMPALRLRAFVDGFDADRRSFRSICEDDFEPALRELGAVLTATLRDRACFVEPLVDVDPVMAGVQPDCTVYDVPPDPGARARLVPFCAGEDRPCWRTVADASCGGGISVTVDRAGLEAAPGTFVQVKCATCTRGATDCAQR